MAFLKSVLIVALAFLATYWYTVGKKQEYNPDEIRGKRVLITGASSGIGKEMALKFASMGADLVLTARTVSKLEQVVSECKKLGSKKAYYISADMFAIESADLVIKTAMEKLGGIDILILNHIGSTYFGGYRRDVEHLGSLLVANTLTHAHMASLSLDNLTKNNGRIVVVSSAVGLVGGPLTIPYATTKAALNGFFKSLSLELAYNKTEQVSISTCHLGLIGTDTGFKFKDRLTAMPADVGECANEIIRGSMAREKEIYFPGDVAWIPLLNALFPDWMRKNVLQAYA